MLGEQKLSDVAVIMDTFQRHALPLNKKGAARFSKEKDSVSCITNLHCGHAGPRVTDLKF